MFLSKTVSIGGFSKTEVILLVSKTIISDILVLLTHFGEHGAGPMAESGDL